MDGEQSEVQSIDIQPKNTVHARKIHERDPAFLGHLKSDRLERELEAARMSAGEEVLTNVEISQNIARSERQKGDIEVTNHFLSESEQTIDEARDALRIFYSGTKEQKPTKIMRGYIEATIFSILKDLKGDVRQIKDIFNKDKVSNGVLEIALRRYDENYRAKQEALLHNGDVYKDKFKERIKQLASEGEIAVNLSLVDQRLQRVQLHMDDPLGWDTPSVRLGSSDNLFELIGISAIVDEKDVEANVFHELLHQVAGRTIVEFAKRPITPDERVKGSEEDLDNLFQSDTGVAVPRAGLRFVPYTDMYKASKKERFSWLDEAVTEDLTAKLLPNFQADNDNKAYTEEVKLLNLLAKTVGVEKKLFYDAYFENDFDEKGNQGNLSARRELFKAINTTLGAGFLREIDQRIKKDSKEGIVYALNKLREFDHTSEKPVNTEDKALLAA